MAEKLNIDELKAMIANQIKNEKIKGKNNNATNYNQLFFK